MQTVHNGYEINVTIEECCAGWEQLYYSITRLSDGYECYSSFEDSMETIESKTEQLKGHIDAELKERDPWDEAEEYGWPFCDACNLPITHKQNNVGHECDLHEECAKGDYSA